MRKKKTKDYFFRREETGIPQLLHIEACKISSTAAIPTIHFEKRGSIPQSQTAKSRIITPNTISVSLQLHIGHLQETTVARVNKATVKSKPSESDTHRLRSS